MDTDTHTHTHTIYIRVVYIVFPSKNPIIEKNLFYELPKSYGLQSHISVPSQRQLDLLACVSVNCFNVHTHTIMEAVAVIGWGAFPETISHRTVAVLHEMRRGSRVYKNQRHYFHFLK